MIKKNEDTEIYTRGDSYVRSTFHEFDSYLNIGKSSYISDVVDEYRRIMDICLEELWNKQIKDDGYIIFLKHNVIVGRFPQRLRVKDFNCLKTYRGNLSGRLISNMLNQLGGVIRGCIESAAKTNKKVVKPTVTNQEIELPPKFIDMRKNDNTDSEFRLNIRLVNLTKKDKDIIIPTKTHAMDDKYDETNRLKSIKLNKKKITLRYKIKPKDNIEQHEKNLNKVGVVGVDTGKRKLASLSNGEKTPKQDSQNKTLDELLIKLNRKQYYSKGYFSVLREIECFMNEVVGKINISEFGVMRIESNKGLKKNTNNANHHWKTQYIYNKLIRMCQDNQVDCIYTPAFFKSQRCAECGYVHRKNRKDEEFICLNCHHTDDADNNSGRNNSIKLPYITKVVWLYRREHRDSGFFWNLDGIVLNDKIGSAASPNTK